MKKFSVLSIILLIAATSCNTEPKFDGYVIEGKAPGVYNGIRAYLKVYGVRNRLVPVDTAIVMNGAFVFKSKSKNPGLHQLTIDNVNGSLPLIIDNQENFAITIDKDNITKSVVEGATSTTLYNEYKEGLKQNQQRLRTLISQQRRAHFEKDSEKLESITLQIEDTQEELQDEGFMFVKAHPSSAVSMIILDELLKDRNLNVEKFITILDDLGGTLKNSEKAKQFLATAEQILENQKKAEATKIGKVAPNFSAPTPNGERLALNDVVKKGKVTIIDFWAAWCGPCRKENPNVVNIYNKYHDKGLEIIGVGLDGRRGQNNPKETWIKAIEDDKLTWHQVSNLKYFDDIAKLYNVNAIPAMFVLNDKGEIVAKNLRGPQLEAKVKELLGA